VYGDQETGPIKDDVRQRETRFIPGENPTKIGEKAGVGRKSRANTHQHDPSDRRNPLKDRSTRSLKDPERLGNYLVGWDYRGGMGKGSRTRPRGGKRNHPDGRRK